MTESEMIAALADGQRWGIHTVDGPPFAALDRAAAYRVQAGVMEAVGATVGMIKTAVQADGVGVAAPIYADRLGRTGYRLPVSNVLGLEVEVGLVLGKDVMSRSDVAGAIDHFFAGVEIVGSRFVDRDLAGPIGGLADNMSALAYVIGTEPRRLKDDISGLKVALEFAGKAIFAGPARQGFGTVLASLEAYADAQQAFMPLRAGAIVTTGSLCGLVPTSGTGHVVARLGGDVVEMDLV